MKGIPTVLTVSRETGKIIEVKAEEVSQEDFRRICQAMAGHGRGCGKSLFHIREEAEDGLYSGADNRNSGGNP